MARKPRILRGVAAVLLPLVALGASGCASGRQSKSMNAGVANVAPSGLPATSVSSDASRRDTVNAVSTNPSYMNPSYANPSYATPGGASPVTANDSKDLSTASKTELSRPSGRGCGSGGCSRCGA